MNSDDIDNFIVKKFNFEMDTETRVLINKKLQILQEEVPLYSVFYLEITREMKDGYVFYYGQIKINTTSEQFYAEACRLSLHKLLMKLEADINTQIDNWKEIRFQKIQERSFSYPELARGYS